jgi:hypothetical protein
MVSIQPPFPAEPPLFWGSVPFRMQNSIAIITYCTFCYKFFIDAHAGGGPGKVDLWAPFARIGRPLGRQFRLDLNGRATFTGKIIIEDRNARHIGETGYDTAPFVGLTPQGKF